MKSLDKFQIITFSLSAIIIISLIYFIYSVFNGELGRAAVSVDLAYNKAKVLIDEKDFGETPVYTEDIYSTGEIKVDINGETNSYSTLIRPSAGTLAVLKRDLGVSNTFSSGQNVWFEKSGGTESVISVTSPDTSDVTVIADDVEVGKTPIRFTTKDLLTQNDENKYTLTFKKEGYEEQSAVINASEGYTVNIRVDMFLNPLPSDIALLEGFPDGATFIDFTNSSPLNIEERQDWAKAINYWLSTRGEATFGDAKISEFDYFIDQEGAVYNIDGNKIDASEMKVVEDTIIAYLGDSDTSGLSELAQKTISDALGEEIVTNKDEVLIKIKPTGLNFLNVRENPTTSSRILTKLDIGTTHKYVSEENGWYQIEYEEGKNGWISGLYGEKIEPSDTEENNEQASSENGE